MTVAVGDLVTVPFRRRDVVGVVRALKETTGEHKLAFIKGVENRSWCTEDDLHRLDAIAQAIIQSPSSLFHALTPTLPVLPNTVAKRARTKHTKRTVKRADVERVSGILKSTKNIQPVFGDFELGIVLVHALAKTVKGQLLVLVPTERDAELVGLGTSIHGHTKPQERARVTEGWRRGDIRVLVGTRIASLLPAHNLDAIVILEASNDEHQSSRRNPRFDAREAAKLLANQHGAKLFIVDPVPRLEDLIPSFPPEPQPTPSTPSPFLISLKNPLEQTDLDLISGTLLMKIENALRQQKNVLLFLNRKGVAKRLECTACGHIPLCGTCGNVPSVRLGDLICMRCGTEMWAPKICPSCGKPRIALKGIGGGKVVESLKKHFQEATVGRIEKGGIESPNANILVVTEYFFSSFHKPFDRGHFGVVADLATDIGLHGENFRSAEITARKIHRFLMLAEREEAECIFQTWLPDVIAPMLKAKEFLKGETELRRRYFLPPFASRYLLSSATLDELPENVRAHARIRDDTIELKTDDRELIENALLTLPDSVTITADTSYGIPDRSPQSE